MLEIHTHDKNSALYKKIISHLEKTSEMISNVQSSDVIPEEHDFVLSSRDFFEHVSKCRECRDKIQSIMSHKDKKTTGSSS